MSQIVSNHFVQLHVVIYGAIIIQDSQTQIVSKKKKEKEQKEKEKEKKNSDFGYIFKFEICVIKGGC